MLKDLIVHIAKALVDKPEEVVVTEIEGQQIYVIELKVAKEDIGKIIGKQGRTVQAIRTILNAVSAKMRKRSSLEIIESYRARFHLASQPRVMKMIRSHRGGRVKVDVQYDFKDDTIIE